MKLSDGRQRFRLKGLDEFLHSQEEGKRSPELVSLEAALKDELTREFADIVPSVEFELPE